MNPWLETAGVVLVAVLGVLLGRFFSGLRKPYWLLGYFLSLTLIVMLVLVRFNNALYFVRPFSWITSGRVKFVILSLAVTMGLTVLLSRLPRKCEKLLVCIIMFMVVTWFLVMPFLVPALIKDHLSKLMIKKQANTEMIFAQAMKEGMSTLRQDGIMRVFKGLTDMSEVRRVCIA